MLRPFSHSAACCYAKFETDQCIERFHSRGEHLCKLMGTSADVNKTFNFYWIGLEHQHGRVSLFWYTNMAAVVSCENALFVQDGMIFLILNLNVS